MAAGLDFILLDHRRRIEGELFILTIRPSSLTIQYRKRKKRDTKVFCESGANTFVSLNFY
jgi:hypothetical protein